MIDILDARPNKPRARLVPCQAAGARWQWLAAAGLLGLPLLAVAAPVLSVSIGAFQSGGCLAGHGGDSAVIGPLTRSASCSDRGGLRTGEAFATADYGSLGASTFLTLQPTPGLGNTGFARTSFAGDYVFSGPGSSIAVNLNLDLDGRLALSGGGDGKFASSSVLITLQKPGGPFTQTVSIDEAGHTVVLGNLDDDADYDALLTPAGGSVEIDTNGFTVPVGVPVSITLSLQAAATTGAAGGGGFVTSLSEFGSTLTFNRDGTVFSLPAGFTVNGPGVVNNRWVGASSVPEPAPALLVGAGLLHLIWLRRRSRGNPADRT